ncbi:MAG TPA: 50S ribosomal protein L35 [Terriglobales bacterium]|nr:50S ribosomal protein L35 [Terriglobales bacterium]
MPKLKSHRGASKRFHTTGTGKIVRGHSGARHILTTKSRKRKRTLDQETLISAADRRRIARMIPYV